ncbi:hypothetical protein MMC28_011632 [Mycoblastus sanguinarius]|nr:hypothetical protein [Mycoblastus sanguinarius]
MQPTLAPAPHPMRASVQQENVADRALREQLLAQVQNHHLSPHRPEHQLSNTASPHHHNIDPAIAGSGIMNPSAGDSGGDDNGSDGRKSGKRELSTSKRAAQNRAAQRAFRQRKEGHIKSLETQVREFNHLNENYKALQAENYQLRDYIISLQSRLLESQGEYPQPPSNIEIPHPTSSGPPPQQVPAPTAPMGSSAASQLQASAAQAVADMGGSKHSHEESPYIRGGNLPNKRTRIGEDTDMRSPSGPPPHAENRPVAV